MILVGKQGNGDDFGIGSDKSYNIIEIARMLKMNYKIKPAKKGNRLDGKLITSKTKKLGWKPLKNLKEYLNNSI